MTVAASTIDIRTMVLSTREGYDSALRMTYTASRFVPAYELTEPEVAAFVVIPLVLAALLAGGVAVVWRRSGASSAAARRAALITAVATGAWMAVTWIAGTNGI